MNNSINHKRKEAMLHKALSEIIAKEVKNSKVSYPTVTDVKLSADAAHAIVYLTFESFPKQSLEGLKQAKGFIKSRLSRLNLRIIPNLDFRIDDVPERANRIEEILRNIKNN